MDDPVTLEMARRYISEILEHQIDTLVLGCTHYPLLRKTIRKVVERILYWLIRHMKQPNPW